jgi:hypothetical protein
MWSANFAGREPQQNFQGDINWLDNENGLEVEEGPLQGPPAPAGQYVVPEAANAEPKFNITIEEWSDMSKPAKRNFIINEAVNRHSETVEFNGRERKKWEIMTPTDRQNELAKVRNEIGRQLKIKI